MIIDFLSCPSPYDKLAPVFTILRSGIKFGSIIIPILLIIFGMIDFGKAVVAKEESEIKKAQLLFVKRVCYGVAILFIVSLVSLLMHLLADSVGGSENSWGNWLDCLYGEDR